MNSLKSRYIAIGRLCDISLTSEVFLLELVEIGHFSKLGIFKDWKGFACKPPSVLICCEILFTVKSGCISETVGFLKVLKSVKYWTLTGVQYCFLWLLLCWVRLTPLRRNASRSLFELIILTFYVVVVITLLFLYLHQLW